MILLFLAAAAVATAPPHIDPRLKLWANTQMQAAQKMGQDCGTTYASTGAQLVLRPATVADDPTFDKERTAVRNGRGAVQACLDSGQHLLAQAKLDLAKIGLKPADQAATLDGFRSHFIAAMTEDAGKIGVYLDALDAVLAHLQASKAVWDPAKKAFVFPNPDDLTKFQALGAKAQAIGLQMREDSARNAAKAKEAEAATAKP